MKNKNQAIGMIETQGLIALIEATDAMLKTAEVHLLGKNKVGSGINTVLITGDVAAVSTAVEAGKQSILNLGSHLLLAAHVIPRAEIDSDLFVQTEKVEISSMRTISSSKELDLTEKKSLKTVENTIENTSLTDLKNVSEPTELTESLLIEEQSTLKK